jgi:Bacterial Ig-like domain (group 3)
MFRPRLESLEDRVTPANHTMTFAGAFDVLSGSQLNGDPAIGVSGEKVGFVAEVQNIDSSAAPTGTIQFTLDGIPDGIPQPLQPLGDPNNPNYAFAVSPVSSFTVASGTHSITAHYSNTDGAFIPPASDAQVGYKSDRASTTTSDVTSSNSSSLVGQTVTLTAKVGVSSPGSGTPTGMVSFSDQTGVIGSAQLSAGVATLTIATLDTSHSPHTITASYGGDGEFVASDDTKGAPLQQTVSKMGATAALAPFTNPTGGQAISFTAVVTNSNNTGLAPTGTVQFINNGVNLGSPVQLTPVAGDPNQSMAVSPSTSFTHAQGPQVIGVTYTNTDGSFVSGASDACSLWADKILVTTSLAPFSNPTSGQTVSFTAKVGNGNLTGLAPTGTVQFTDNGVNLGGPVQLTPVNGDPNNSTAVSASTSFTVAQGVQTIAFTYTNTDGSFVSGGSASGGFLAMQIATTTSNVSSSNASAFAGQTLTLTATVAAVSPATATPNGTVTFSDQTGVIGSAPLSAGVATLRIATLDASHSPHTITASYGGGTEFFSSNDTKGTPLQQTVSKMGATGALAPFSNPTSGQIVSFTAIVSNSNNTGLAPTGTVQFTDNGANLGSAVQLTPVTGDPNQSMAVSATTSFTVAQGPQLVAFTYTNSDGSFVSGASDSHSLTAVQIATRTSDVTSVPNPTVHGQGVILLVNVVSNPAGSVPVGAVTFRDQNGTIGTGTLGSTGQASFSTSTLSTSSHTITASYVGSSEFGASNDASSLTPLVQVVAKASTAAGAVASSANPAVRGQKITLSASFTAVGPGSGVPTGKVTFSDQNGSLGAGTLSATGVATFSTSTLSIATHAITATYAGDANFSGIASAAFSESVTKAAAIVSVASSPLASVFSQLVTLTATVRAAPPGAGMPTGTVTFKQGTLVLGTGTLALSSATEIATVTTKALPVGSDTLTAVYSGDSVFRTGTGSDSTSPQQVHKAATTTSLLASANPSVFGQSITLTATIKVTGPGSGTATGIVTFKDGNTVLGMGTLHLVGGLNQATASTKALSVGSHALSAIYAGSSSFVTSSTFATQQVNKAGTTTSVTSSLNPSLFHQTVTFSASVRARVPGSGVPTGMVMFKDGTTTLGTQALNNAGLATFSTSSLTVGSHTITTSYVGDNNFVASASSVPVLVQSVHSSHAATRATRYAHAGHGAGRWADFHLRVARPGLRGLGLERGPPARGHRSIRPGQLRKHGQLGGDRLWHHAGLVHHRYRHRRLGPGRR